MSKEKSKEKKQSRVSVQKMVLLAVLIAIILLMSVTPLGYLKTGGLEITFNLIPLAIGAVVLGPSGGAILGAVFGLTSFCQCIGILGFSQFGAVLLSINPVLTFITCMVPRVLCGWIAGLVYKLLSRFDKTKLLSHAAACVVCPLLNTILFMASTMVFFGSSDYISGLQGTMNPFAFVAAFVGINGIVEIIVCLVVATAIAKALTVVQSKLEPKKAKA